MNNRIIKSDLILLLTAAIWGFAFVAQRIGMDFLGPFWFSAIRFALGGLFLIPISAANRKKRIIKDIVSLRSIKIYVLAGSVLFIAANLQQIGLVYTTAGKAGFITGLYVVLVPLIGLFIGKKNKALVWIGAVSAATGLYILSVTDSFFMAKGDLLVSIGAFFWTAHILIIDKYSSTTDALCFSIGQFLVCSILSAITAVATEPVSFSSVKDAFPALIYGGVFSIGIAYTLQVVAQKTIHPTHAAIILSLESVFAVAGGVIFLKEILTVRAIIGSILMLSGMIISQVRAEDKKIAPVKK